MASILRSPPLLLPPPCRKPGALEIPRCVLRFSVSPRTKGLSFLKFVAVPEKSVRVRRLVPFVANGETADTEEIEETILAEGGTGDESKVEDGATNGSVIDSEKKTTSVVMASLQSYKEALANDDQSTLAEIESFLLSIEDEKEFLAKKVASLGEELSIEKDRVLRISADFDNFRKRTEREKLSLMENVQGEVLEKLLPVLDNFERAKSQIKVETEGEEKINGSYQSIYKQFVEILQSLGVEAVETVGSAFDPMLHEAIMREDSDEFEEGIILQEFRKGFKLGDRLLRPSMVKVSAGPGPAKSNEEPLPVVEENSKEESSTEDTEEDGEAA